MNIIFIGSLCPPALYQESCEKHYTFDSASIVLQNAVLRGLSDYVRTTISYPTIVPKDKIFIPEEVYPSIYCKENISVKCINIPGIKQVLAPFFTIKHLRKINYIPDAVLVYAVQSHSLKIAQKIKQRFPKCKVVLMVPDLAEFMSAKTGAIYLKLKRIEAALVNKYIECVDGYILLSEYMTEKLPVGVKPHIVVEGIWGGALNIGTPEKSIDDNSYKTILYTGTLALRFGVKNLIDAFSAISDRKYRLLICGKGDGEDYVKEAVAKDLRISYLGQLTRDEVITLQKKVDLLVNPRSAKGEFTRYSFPSKTIEYFVSGTPTLLCKLPAIPQEYYRYCFSVEDTSVENLKNKIIEIFQKPKSDLVAMGNEAQQFILKHKNALVQGHRILDFIKLL